ncbi:MAG: ATP-binding cassette domain-containing protein [Bacilli bacterium]|jgi:ABC-type sugar transport system ATPase subunit
MREDKKRLKEQYSESHGQIIDESIDSFVYLKNVKKVYPNGAIGVREFTLGIDRYDFIALVGPSGCGKSTTLRMIAGLEEITDGYLYIDKKLTNYVPSKDRDIAMVFQSYALYPHINVYENIAFGLKLRKIGKDEIERRVFEVARILNLGHYLDRKPKELSGGQMQRVALGRAIVREARIFLMDEPLSNLDAKLRVSMRGELVRIHNDAKATTIYVTHDQIEAMTMANKIVVMNKGYIQQVGHPRQVYESPNNLFVATFIGTPSMNLFEAIYEDGDIKLIGRMLSFESWKKQTDGFYKREIASIEKAKQDPLGEGDDLISRHSASQEQFVADEAKPNGKSKKGHDKRQVSEQEVLAQLAELEKKLQVGLSSKHPIIVGIRSEHVLLSQDANKGALIPFEATVDFVELLGSTQIVHARIGTSEIAISADAGLEFKLGDKIPLFMRLDHIHLYDPVTGKRIN